MLDALFNSLNINWRLQRKPGYSQLRGNVFKLLGVVLALIVAGIVVELSGHSAADMAKSIIEVTLSSSFGREQLMNVATPLILTGAAMMLGSRMQLYNFGMEGQIYIGAFAASALGLHLQGPYIVIMPLMFLLGMFGGAFYAFIPAFLRIKAGIGEILTTLLMNYLAVQFTNYIAMGPWRDPGYGSFSSRATRIIPYDLPIFSGNVHLGLLIAIAVVILVWFVSQGTVWGYEITSVGSNQNTAKFAGMPIKKYILIVMLVSGAIAGLAGVIQLTDNSHRFSPSLSRNYGWLGINVAILSGNSPLLLIPWGIFQALVLYAGIVMRAQGMSVNLVTALSGLILFFICIAEVIANYRFVRTPSKVKNPIGNVGSEKGLKNT